MNYVSLNSQVITDKLGWISVIGVNASDLCGREKYIIGLLPGKKIVHFLLLGQVKLAMSASEEISVPFGLKFAYES